MDYEIEFKMIDIKDINKIQHTEKCEAPFGGDIETESIRDITDEYCKDVLQKAIAQTGIECKWRYIGCTDRIGHYEFEISNSENKYTVVFQQDTYEWNLQLTVQIGYREASIKNEQWFDFENRTTKECGNSERLIVPQNTYDIFLEKIKLCIKNSMVRDWYKCVWMSDNQSLWLSKEVYSEIYMAENELRAFVNKVMIENFGSEWHDKPEFSKLGASIELNAGNVKRSVPNFANIEVNLYTATLETLIDTVKSDIYTDTMPNMPEIQKVIKSKIFATTQLDKMQSALDYLRTQYTKKYNVWDKFFVPLIKEPDRFEQSLSDFIANRNHVAHNKLLDISAKNKMLSDTLEFRRFIKAAIRKFENENHSEEVEETLRSIEEQREYEREAQLEVIESESGITIRNREKILDLFSDVVHDIYNSIHECLYFNEEMDVKEISLLKDYTDEQKLFQITFCQRNILSIYGLIDIDDSEGVTSTLQISVIGENDEDIITENIEYINGEAEYNSEQTSFMPVVEDFLDDGNKEYVKEEIEEFLRRKIEEFDTMGTSETRNAEEDWQADAADILEERE